ncbi:MAG: hypothetical protein ABSF50_06305 [Burkholderiaceae bacterium]|jgi:hypothetical protein
MKNILFLLLLVTGVCLQPALGQSSVAPADGTELNQASGVQGGGRPTFEALKQRRLQELQALLRCVSASNNRAELRACRIQHPERTGHPAIQ